MGSEYRANMIMSAYPQNVCDARESMEDWAQFSKWQNTSDAEMWILNHGGLIMAIAKKYANWQYSAEDLFQELALHVFAHFDSYDRNWVETKDTTFFYTIMEHKVFEIYRRGNAQSRAAYQCSSLEFITKAMHFHQTEQAEEQEDELSITDITGSLLPTDEMEDAIIEKLFYQDVLAQINKMKDVRKRIFMLYLNGYTQMEIAATVGCVQSAVSYHINKAQETLREYFKEVS